MEFIEIRKAGGLLFPFRKQPILQCRCNFPTTVVAICNIYTIKIDMIQLQFILFIFLLGYFFYIISSLGVNLGLDLG